MSICSFLSCVILNSIFNQFVTHDTGLLNRCNVPLDERNGEDDTLPFKRELLFFNAFRLIFLPSLIFDRRFIISLKGIKLSDGVAVDVAVAVGAGFKADWVTGQKNSGSQALDLGSDV